MAVNFHGASPRCIATAINTVDQKGSDRFSEELQNNYFRSAEWTADGTSLVTNSADNQIRTFVVPPDLLDERHSPLQLSPHSKIPAAEPVNAVASFPFFHLEDPSTTILLSSIRDHPIRLNSALDSTLLASYPLVNPTNEKFISPHSLLFATDGTKFLAGSDSLLAVFDSSRPGQEPISWLPTGFRRRRLSLDSGMTMRGIVSALALDNSSGILAAGTFSRCVGLYESEGQGGCIGVFRVDDTSADKSIGGRGVTQLRWSSCGRYLYIVERRSDGAMIYDIRKTGQLLSWLEGRKAMTSQRLGVDVAAGIGEGHQNVWAGGTDGRIRVWQNPHQTEGPQKTKFEWEGHQAAISGTVVHYSGLVVATCAGERRLANPGEEQLDRVLSREEGSAVDQSKAIDNSLKIWRLPESEQQ